MRAGKRSRRAGAGVHSLAVGGWAERVLCRVLLNVSFEGVSKDLGFDEWRKDGEKLL